MADWNGIAPSPFVFREGEHSERWVVIVTTPKEYRHQAEECLGLASLAMELYVKDALLELAAEFREKAERLEARHEA